MDAAPRNRQRQPSTQQGTQSSFVQVCDRCRWKKIKCDGARPCSNCRNASFPCETRARLSKQATPRSYVQYLEARIRQLEGRRDNDPSPTSSGTQQSSHGDPHSRSVYSPNSSEGQKKAIEADATVLKELGSHIVDEDGLSRYMGPSSGVGFATKILRDILDNDCPPDHDYYSLFSLDDSPRGRALADADSMLWQTNSKDLPPKEVTDAVLQSFFTFTERTFPVLHRPTFLNTIDELYGMESIQPESFEILAQLWFALSVGYCFDARTDEEYRVPNQIRAYQNASRFLYANTHRRMDGILRLQTLSLYAYSLVLLRQRSQALKVSALANTKALECGLHHDGHQFRGNPLETEMRRRVFWCVFMLHLCNSSLTGLPRSLHEADITIADPSDIDDDQLTTTEVLNKIPGRTKIHRFVSIVRLLRILSRALDVLYTQNKRKHASTRIEQMNRLCCEHLLDQLDFSFEETPDDLPDPNSDDLQDMATMASYANEQCLYHYIRWIIHRPGLALSQNDPHFASCLQTSTEAAAAIIRCVDTYKHVCPLITMNPAANGCTTFIAALTPLYRAWLLQQQSHGMPMLGFSTEADLDACRSALSVMAYSSSDHSDVVRRRVLQALVSKVFGDDHQELQRLESITSNPEVSYTPFYSRSNSVTAQNLQDSQMPRGLLRYREHQIEHFTAHEDLRTFVHEAFSPGLGGQEMEDI